MLFEQTEESFASSDAPTMQDSVRKKLEDDPADPNFDTRLYFKRMKKDLDVSDLYENG